MSYSRFAYGHLKLSAQTVQAGAPLTVEADVTNTSKVAGDEVAELYLTPPASPVNPLRKLAGFTRVHLAPGETKHVVFTLTRRDLSFVTAEGAHKIQPGRYVVFVGGSQPGPKSPGVQATFPITGEYTLPR